MKKVDLKNELKPLYRASAHEVGEVDVPTQHYLMIDGEGDPNSSPAFQAGVEALFALAYAIKFAVKRGPLAIDYGVMPLEGLWWADDARSFASSDRSRWKWTLLILQPAFVTRAMVDEAIAQVRAKKRLPALERVRFEPLAEGQCAQILHIGPFSAEGPTIARLHDHIAASGRQRTGKHHEVYLSDVRKAAPASWKTVLRQPMR